MTVAYMADSAVTVQSECRTCSECGHQVDKAKRIHKGHPICVNCYERIFIKTRCSRCGGSVRAHKNDPSPICHPCITKDRTCLRCAKPTPRAGLIVNGHAVCNSCSPHFRQKKPCTRCGTLSAKLSSITGITDEAVCEHCQRQLAYATCVQCGKHRKQYFSLLSRKSVCKQCVEAPSQSGKCPDCRIESKRSGKSPCLACAVKRSLKKKQTFIAASLQHEETTALLNEFVEWTVRHDRGSQVSRRFAIYAGFFTKIDNTSVRLVNDKVIKSLFSPEELRRLGVVTQFLADRGYLLTSTMDRQAWSEERRIHRLLEQAAHEPWHELIKQYGSWLSADSAKPLALRTRRLYLHAAALLMREQNILQASDIDDRRISQFLKKHPGHYASLTSFARYLSEAHHVKVLFVKASKKRKGLVKTERTHLVAKLLSALHQDIPAKTKQACIAKLLSILYSVAFCEILQLKRHAVTTSAHGMHIQFKHESLEIDTRIVSSITLYLLQQSAGQINDDRLFQGRSVNDALSVEAANYHLKKILA